MRSWWWFAFGVAVILWAGCGDDPNADGVLVILEPASEEGEETDVTEMDEVPSDESGPAVIDPDLVESGGQCAPMDRRSTLNGFFYVDHDESERSTYTGGPFEGDSPFAGDITVIGSETARLERCNDGSYRVSELGEGTMLAVPAVPAGRRCTTANCPGRFARAIQEGRTPVMVTFGDSVAVLGARPLFPERIRSLFETLTDIESRNVAIAGTTSQDWLPNGRYFTRNLAPELEDADLIVVSIGGNDIVAYINEIGIPSDIPAAVEGARLAVLQVIDNMRAILRAIRAVNSDVDIAYCLYVDYSQATNDPIWNIVRNVIGDDTLAEIIREARENFPTDDPHLMMVDLFGAADGLVLDQYLYDQLHFNDRGHTLYAEEVFETLGGILIGTNPLGFTGRSPLGLRRSYGFSPLD